MVRQRYLGVSNPQREFDELRPLYRKLRAMQGCCVPLKADYMALEAALTALRQAAIHFTKDPFFYGGRPMTSFGAAREDPAEPPPDEGGR